MMCCRLRPRLCLRRRHLGQHNILNCSIEVRGLHPKYSSPPQEQVWERRSDAELRNTRRWRRVSARIRFYLSCSRFTSRKSQSRASEEPAKHLMSYSSGDSSHTRVFIQGTTE